MANEQEILIKILGDAKSLLSAFGESAKGADKLKDTINRIQDAEDKLAKARETASKARESGDAKAIASAEKELASKQKSFDQMKKLLEQELSEVQKTIEKEELEHQKQAEKEQALLEDTRKTALKGLSELKEGVKEAFESIASGGSPLDGLQKAFEGLGKLGGPLGELFSKITGNGIELVKVFGEFVEKANESQKQIDQLVQTTGLLPETVAALRTGANQVGQSFVQVIGAVDRFAERVKGANDGNAKSVEIFEKLKVSIRDTEGNLRPLNDLFEEAVKKFAALPGGTEKAALGYETFGLRSQKIINAIGDNLDKLKQQAKESGIILDEASANSLRKFNQTFIELQNNVEGLRNIIGGRFADTFETLAGFAKDAFKEFRADPATIEGLKVISDILEKLVKTIGLSLIDAVKDATKIIADVGFAISRLPEPVLRFLGVTKETIDELKNFGSQSDKTKESNKELADSFDKTGLSVKGLIENIKLLREEQQNQSKEAEIKAKQQLALIDQQFELGLIGEKKAAEERAKINNDEADRKRKEVQDELNLVKDTLTQKASALKTNLDSLVNAEKDSNNKRIAASKEFDEAKQSSTKKVYEAEVELGKKTDQISKDKLAKIKQDEAQRVEDSRNNLSKIADENEQLKAKIITAQNELAQFRKATNLQEVVDLKQLTEEQIALRKTLFEADVKNEQAKAEQIKKSAEGQKAINQAAFNERKSQLAKDVEDVKRQQDEIVASINKSEHELEISHTEAAKRRAEANKVPIQTEIDGLQKILATATLNGKEKEEIEKRLAKVKEELAKKDVEENKKTEEAKKKDIDETNKFLEESIKTRNAQQKANSEAIKSAEANILERFKEGELSKQEAIRKTFQLQLVLIQKTLELELSNLAELKQEKENGRDVDDKIVASNAEITKLQAEQIALQKALKGELDGTSDSVNKIVKEFNNVEKAQNKQTDAVEKTKKKQQELNDVINETAGKILSVSKSFDANTASIEEIRKKIEDLRKDSEELLLNSQAVVAGRIDAALSFIDVADELERKLNERLIKEGAEAERQKANQAIAERQRAAQEAFKIAKQEKEEETNLKTEFIAKEKEIDDEINKNKLDAAITLDELKQTQAKQLEAFDKDEKQKELDRADQQHDALLQKESDFQSQLQATKDKAEEEGAKKTSDAARKAADIDLQLQDLIEKRKNEKDPNNQKSLDEQIKQKQAELANADKSEADRAAREKRRQEEIAKAQATAQEKLKGAKSDTEVAEIEKELGIQLDGIDKKFANEQKYAEDLAKYQGKVSQERLDAITAAYKAEQAIVEQNVQNRIDAEKQQAQLTEDARKKAADKEKADAEARRQSLIDQQKKEYDDRKKSFEDKQTQLEKALKAERESYKTHLEELRTKTAQSLADIASSFTDGGAAAEKFFKDFAANAGLTGKAIDEILTKLKQFKDQIASDNQQQNNASGSTGNGNSNRQQNSGVGNNFGGNGQPGQGNQGGIGNSLGQQQGGFGFGLTEAPNQQANPSSSTSNNSASNNSSSNNINPNQKTGNGLSTNNGNVGDKNPGRGDSNPDNNSGSSNQEKGEKFGRFSLPSSIPSAEVFFRVSKENHDKYEKYASNGGQDRKVISDFFSILLDATNLYGEGIIKDFQNTNKGYKYYDDLLLQKIKGTGIRGQFIKVAEDYAKDYKKRSVYEKFIAKYVELCESVRAEALADKKQSDKGSGITADTGIDPSSGGITPPPDDGPGLISIDKSGLDSIGGIGRGKLPGKEQQSQPKTPFVPDRSQEETSYEGEGASKKGFVRVAPDAAVGGSPNKPPAQAQNQTPNASKPTLTDKDKPLAQVDTETQPQATGQIPNQDTLSSQTINQSNSNQVTVNLQVQGFLGDKKTVNQLEELFSNLMNQQNQINQDRLRQLNGASLARRG